MVFFLIISFCMIILIDISGLLKSNKRRKTMLVYLFLLSIGFTISLLLILDIAPTSPTVVIENIVRNLFMR